MDLSGPVPRSPRPLRPMRALARLGTLMGLGVLTACGDPDTGAQLFPPLLEQIPQSEMDFVGAESCSGCHESAYERWASSTHGQAGGLPGEVEILAPFSGQRIPVGDAVVTANAVDERWWFTVAWEGEVWEFEVVGVVGRGAMLGGGTQGYVTSSDDGTVRFLPFDWSETLGTWFCNTSGRGDEGWVPFSEAVVLADCADWPPRRILGNHGRFQNCQSCHGSQIEVSFAADQGYSTDWTSLRVECESCHGPASAHVAWAASDAPGENPQIAGLSALDEDASLSVCLACHSLKTPLTPGFRTGDADLEKHFSMSLPILDQDPYLPDGRVATFGYQGTHRSSACYLSGTMDCVSCHEPHGQDYWDVNRRPLAGPFDDGQCTACHAAKTADPQAHSRHKDVNCVQCHMPYIQQPGVGNSVPFARSDHTIPTPRPALDDAFGVEGACRSCHSDVAADSLRRDLNRGWGSSPPLRPLVAALVAGRTGLDTPTRSTAAGLTAEGTSNDGLYLQRDGLHLLRPDVHDPVAQVTAMRNYLRQQEAGSDLHGEARTRLWDLTLQGDLDVAAMALAILHLYTEAAEADYEQLHRALRSAQESPNAHHDEALRRRWVAVLTWAGDEALERGDSRGALRAYGKGLELLPNQTFLLQASGLLLQAGGAAEAGDEQLRRAAESDPQNALIRVTMAFSHLRRGDHERAEEEANRALALNPWEPMAYLAAGRVHLSEGRAVEALPLLERGVELDGGNVALWEAIAEASQRAGRDPSRALQRIAVLRRSGGDL